MKIFGVFSTNPGSAPWEARIALLGVLFVILFGLANASTECARADASCQVGQTAQFSSAITVNEDGNDADSRFEGDTDANVFYLDAGNDAVIIGAAAPDASEKLRVNGDLRIESNLLVDTVAKGGILGGTAADTLGVLAVGANDEVLVADSAQSTGMKWLAVAVAPTFLDKAADETVNNNDTLQDDDDLTLAVAANKNYAVWGVFIVDSGVTPNMKLSWSLPASGRADFSVNDGAQGNNNPWTEAADLNLEGAGAGTPIASTFQGTLTIEGTGGTAVIQWAQQTANGSDTKLLEGSWLAFKLLN